MGLFNGTFLKDAEIGFADKGYFLTYRHEILFE